MTQFRNKNYFRGFKSSYRKTFNAIMNYKHLNLCKLPPRRMRVETDEAVKEYTSELEAITMFSKDEKTHITQLFINKIVSEIENNFDKEKGSISVKDFNYFFNNEYENVKNNWKEICADKLNDENYKMDLSFIEDSTENSIELLGKIFGLKYGIRSLYKEESFDFLPKTNRESFSGGGLLVKEYMQTEKVSYSTVMRRIEDKKLNASKNSKGQWVIYPQ